jgi:hypothetical protein
MIKNFHIYCTWMKWNKSIMNWFSFEVKGMYSYCMHKINILIHVFTKWCNLHNRITFRGSSKKKYWLKLCARNYATHDGLVICANGIFQGSTKVLNSQKVIWILFNNPKCGQLIRKKCIYVWTWNTSYVDTNRTHIRIYSSWFKFFSHYNNNTISHSIDYNTYYTSNIRINIKLFSIWSYCCL